MSWALGFTALSIAGGTRGAAYAVSADGNTVVGYVDAGGGCYWTPTSGPIFIGNANAGWGVSADGSVIVGASPPFRWTEATGSVSFGTAGDNVRAISDDASRIVGEMNTGTAVQACYWNSTGSVRTPMGFLPGHDRSQAAAVSADGSVIVGNSMLFSAGTTSQRAWRWTASTGMVDLGAASPATSSIAFDVSADGTVVVGQLVGVTYYGFRWTAASGMVLMGDPISHAPAISGDASTIMVHTWYPSDPDTYPHNYLGYVTVAGLTIPVPVPLSPGGLETGVYPYDGCISGNGRVMAGFSSGTPPGPWVYRATDADVAAKLAMDDVTCTTIPALSVSLVSLRWSDDRGHHYGSPVTQPIGDAGEFRTSLQWQRLGMARDRVFELSWSVPTNTALQGCWLDATPAQS